MTLLVNESEILKCVFLVVLFLPKSKPYLYVFLSFITVLYSLRPITVIDLLVVSLQVINFYF